MTPFTKTLTTNLKTALQSSLGVYGNTRMGALLLLGFSSGLPLLLTQGTPLQAWLTDAQVSEVVIGLFALLGIPYSFKFLWSPLLDRFVPPSPGRLRGSRRRGWLALTQGLLLLGIALLGFQNPTESWLTALGLGELAQTWQPLEVWTRPLFLLGMVVAFLSATQDIAGDAYRTDVLSEREMGAGAAIWVMGYRIAMLVSGGLALSLADQMPWRQVYLLMAVLMGVGLIASYWAPEPESEGIQSPQSLKEAVIDPFRAFWQQHSPGPQVVAILLFIVTYKLADGLAGQMTTTFLKKGLGFTNTDLGLVRTFIGLLATLAGAVAGGAGVNRWGIHRALWVFGILQGVSNLSFVALALIGKNYAAMVGTVVIENFCGGMGTSAFLAFLMSLCARQFTATQYALLSSLFAMGGTVAGASSGYLAAVGWPLFFGLTGLGALPGLLLLPWLRPSAPPEPLE